MVLTLNPRYPLVWRSPSSLQLGVANPVVILTDVSVATERMLAALAVGVSEPGLAMIGRSAGAESDEIAALTDALAPALQTAPIVAEPPIVLLVGSGLSGPSPMLDQLTAILAAADIQVRIAGDAATVMAHDDRGGSENAGIDSAIAIAISHFVLAPALRSVWLRRDIPHLNVNFSDTRVEVGPIIEPGNGPCLYCIERHRTDADAAWPAIVSQLWGRRSALETSTIVGEIAALVARLVIRRLAEDPTQARRPAQDRRPAQAGEPGRARQLTQRSSSTLEIDAQTGERFEHEWEVHPECGCTGLLS